MFKMFSRSSMISVTAAVFLILMTGAATLTANADDSILSGTYEGVPYVLTSDDELIIGQNDTEYTVNCADLIHSIDGMTMNEDTKRIPLTVKGISFRGTVRQSGSCEKMLEGFGELEKADFTGFDTSGATSLYKMFNYCSSLTELDLSSFDTGNVTNMGTMFQGCEKLQDLNISSFETGSVTSMRYMFNKCYMLKSVDLSRFDTGQVTEMQHMFSKCYVMESLDLSNFDTSKVTSMANMFDACENLKSLDLSSFDTAFLGEGGMNAMFHIDKALQVIALGPDIRLMTDPPGRDWTRKMLMNGAAANDPSYKKLSEYDGKNPGWYCTGEALDLLGERTVFCGMDFEDYYGASSLKMNDLIDPADPAGTEYVWEKISGSGMIEGGTASEDGYLRFHASKTGDVAIRLSAVSSGEVLRTVTRNYLVEDTYASYRIVSEVPDDYQTGNVAEIRISIGEDADDAASLRIIPGPDNMISWEQSGTGRVKEAADSDGSNNVFRFEAVTPGYVHLKLTTKDGKWSKKLFFVVSSPVKADKSLTGTGYAGWKKGRLGVVVKDAQILGKQVKPFKRINLDSYVKAISSDYSVISPVRAYWEVPEDYFDGDIIDDDYFGANEEDCSGTGDHWPAGVTIDADVFKPGDVTVYFVNPKNYEVLGKLSFTVTEQDIRDFRSHSLQTDDLYYGEPFTVSAVKGDTVKLKLGSRVWTKTAAKTGSITFNLPLMKIGTSGTLTFTSKCGKYKNTYNIKVEDPVCEDDISCAKVKKTSKKIKLSFYSAKKGDVVKIKVGKKTYTKKCKADKNPFKVTQKIKKQKKGTKIKISVYNKFKQLRCKRTVKVK